MVFQNDLLIVHVYMTDQKYEVEKKLLIGFLLWNIYIMKHTKVKICCVLTFVSQV